MRLFGVIGGTLNQRRSTLWFAEPFDRAFGAPVVVIVTGPVFTVVDVGTVFTVLDQPTNFRVTT